MDPQRLNIYTFYDRENPNSHATTSPYYRGLLDTSLVADRKSNRLSSIVLAQKSPQEVSTNANSLLDPHKLHSQPLFQSKHCHIHVSSSNDQLPLREKRVVLSSIKCPELKIAVYDDEDEATTGSHGSDQNFEACINIWDDDDVEYCTAHQIAWKEYIDRLKKSRLDDNSVKMMSETAVALGGQAIGVLVTDALASRTTTSSSAVCSVEFVSLIGLSCTLAGISLRGKRRALSVLMTKIGALATISAIIISLASDLPPVLTWTVGPVACLVLAVAVALT